MPLFQELDDPLLPIHSERRRIRTSAGWSQDRLARHLGVAQRNICNWEKPAASEPTPVHRTLYRLALRELERLAFERGIDEAYRVIDFQE